MTETIVFIIALGHSGSTLLGHILGAHPQALHIGEIPSPLAKGQPFRCYYCGESLCPVWGSVLSEAFVKSVYSSYSNDSRIRSLISNPLSRLLRQYEPPDSLYVRLFEAFPDIQVIVDSSKQIDWIEWNNRASLYRRIYIHLVRDLRGVVASRIRRYPNVSVSETTRKLVGQLESGRAFYEQQNPRDTLTIHYEDMVTQPEVVSNRLCDLLEVPYLRQMLEFYRLEHHIIGGNRSLSFQVLNERRLSVDHLLDDIGEANQKYYRKNGVGLKLDLRWKEELSQAMIGEFEAIGGQVNREYGYS